MSFHSLPYETHSHMKGFSLDLAFEIEAKGNPEVAYCPGGNSNMKRVMLVGKSELNP